MPFRDETECHTCGQPTLARCPVCGNGACGEHTFSGHRRDGASSDRALAEEVAKRLGVDRLCLPCLNKHFKASGGPSVVIHQTFDPNQARMLVSALRDAGFAVRVIGTLNAVLLGTAQHTCGLTIETPLGQANDAQALIESLVSLQDSMNADEAIVSER